LINSIQQTAPRTVGWAAIMLGIGPYSHSSCFQFFLLFFSCFLFGSVQQIKLATSQLLAARNQFTVAYQQHYQAKYLCVQLSLSKP